MFWHNNNQFYIVLYKKISLIIQNLKWYQSKSIFIIQKFTKKKLTKIIENFIHFFSKNTSNPYNKIPTLKRNHTSSSRCCEPSAQQSKKKRKTRAKAAKTAHEKHTYLARLVQRAAVLLSFPLRHDCELIQRQIKHTSWSFVKTLDRFSRQAFHFFIEFSAIVGRERAGAVFIRRTRARDCRPASREAGKRGTTARHFVAMFAGGGNIQGRCVIFFNNMQVRVYLFVFDLWKF